jgi:predicted nucleic acid-binding protein
MVALLDVNVLIALLDADQLHHVVATHWLRPPATRCTISGQMP